MVKNPPANVVDTREADSIPVSVRSPGGENGNPPQYYFLENPTEEPGGLRSIGSQRV